MSGRKLVITAVVGCAATIGRLWGTKIPLGVPGEWVWERIPFPFDNPLDGILGWFSAALFAIVYCLYAIAVDGYFSTLRRAGRLALLGGLVALGFGWVWTLQESPPDGFRLSKVVWTLYYPGSSGYFYEMRYRPVTTAELLASYVNRMEQGDVLHEGTHPPGLFVLYQGLIRACDASSALRQFAEQTTPDSFRTAFERLQENAARSATPVEPGDASVLWWAALLTQLAALLTLLPLYGLLRCVLPPQTSWRAVVFWPLIPAVTVFLPKSDIIYPLLATMYLWLWMQGLIRRQTAWGLAAGIVLFAGMNLSLAFLPVVLLSVAIAAVGLLQKQSAEGGPDWSRLRSPVAAGLGFGLCVLLAWLIWDIPLPSVWLWNLKNHAGFYEEYSRTYWAWLLVNPIELTVALGVPVSLAAGVRLVDCWNEFRQKSSAEKSPWQTFLADCWTVERSSVWLIPAIWGLLWLSGKNMGEAARLWVIFMPWAIFLAAPCFAAAQTAESAGQPSKKRRTDPSRGRDGFVWQSLLILQALVAIATVTRVSGFHFPG